jgi:hypothetical protein
VKEQRVKGRRSRGKKRKVTGRAQGEEELSKRTKVVCKKFRVRLRRGRVFSSSLKSREG